MIRKNSQKGIAQLAIIAVMAFLALGLPAATKLVQQNQENRSKASESDISINGICGTANGKTFSSLSLEKDDHTLFCQKSSGVTITKVSENNYSWKCIGINGGMTVDCSATIDPNSNTANASISATKTDLYYRFKESNDTRVLGVGMTVFSTIRLNTYEKSISSAKIVYCHTDKLEPILDSVRGEQLNTVVSHKKIDNNCAELKVNFDINKKLTGNTAYEIKIATKIVKTGSGTLSFNVPNSSVLGLNGEIVKFTEFTYGADFKIESDEIISKLTPTPIPSSPYLYFNPQNKNTKMGDIFEVTAGIDSSSNIIGGVDIVGTYDSSKLELISIKKSPSMVFNNKGDCTNPENITPGKFSLTCFISDSRDSMMVKGDLVKLTFKAKSAGSAKIEFSCQNNNLTDSNISNPNIFQDIIACNKNIKANISITGATVINGVCGTVKFSELSINSGKEKPQLLCKSGGLTAFEVNPAKDYYYWTCYGINGGTSTVCGVAKPSNNTAIDGVCGSVKYSELTLTSDKDKPEILCKSGKVVGFERSGANVTDRVPLYYSWDCLGLNGGKTVGCGVNPPTTPQKVINGVCGSVKYSQLSKNSPSDKSITLCKSGKLDDFFTMYERPSSTELTYVWNCLGSNGGRNIQCNVSNTAQKNTPTPTRSPIIVRATGIKISPISLKLKVGQSQNLTYILTPGNSTDTVKWSTSGSGQIRIQKTTLKCSSTDASKCIEAPGTNHLQITGLKAGTVKIKLTTNSNQSAEATITVTNNSTTKPTSTPTKKPTPTPTPSNKVNKIGKYIDLIFDPDDIVKISDENLNLWSSRLNLAYTDYVELTGYKPYNGGKITIKSVSCGDNCPGWAWSGQTISWAKKWWLVDEFEKINNNDDWSFGILHEISHDFDFNDFGNRRGHNFDSELMANFKMVYLIEKRNAKVSPGYSGNYYVGPQIINYYKTADKGYEYAIKNNAFTGDFLTYILLREKDRFGGWDTYKKVFRNLGYKSVTSESASFKAFLNEITLISKKDSKGMFNQQEKDIIIKQYGNIFPQTSTNSKPTAIDGVCGSIKYSELTLTSDKDKPEILCKSGKVVGFERSGANVTDRVPLYYSWDCLGLNGGDTVGCGVNPPATPQKVINGVCGTVKYSQLSKNSPSDKSITLCKSGKLGEFFTMYEKPSSTELTYVWDCLGSNGGRNIQCNVSNTAQKIDGACGSLKYSDITPDINKTNPTLLCKSGKLINFVGVTPNCITGPNCPPANYSWSCIGTNGGKSVKCTKYGNPVINPPIPATKVRVTPIFTRLKVGQNRILTYTLTPSSSTDIVKWVTFGNGLVEIEKTATNQLKITALKAGSIRIKITTSSGKSAQSIIFINK